MAFALLFGGAYLVLPPQTPSAPVITERLLVEEAPVLGTPAVEASPSEEEAGSQPSGPERLATTATREEPEGAEPDSLDARQLEDDPLRPSFDVVRVEPSGESVIAGRGAPDAQITVLQDGKPLAEARTDARGEFVAVPLQRLGPGDRQLTLQSRDREGGLRESLDAVVVAMPERTEPQPDDQRLQTTADAPEEPPANPEPATTMEAAAESRQPGDGHASRADTAPRTPATRSERPFAAVVPREGAGEVRVLQQPEPEAAPRAGRLALETVQYTSDGHLVLAGYGTVGTRVLFYLNNAVIGAAVVSADGRWRFQPDAPIEPGLHRLRIDEVDEDGAAQARLETPFNSQPLLTLDEGEQVLVVQPGHNLWTIARRTYGQGWLYTTIFQANRDQIRDPDLIYPGQVFVLPETQ